MSRRGRNGTDERMRAEARGWVCGSRLRLDDMIQKLGRALSTVFPMLPIYLHFEFLPAIVRYSAHCLWFINLMFNFWIRRPHNFFHLRHATNESLSSRASESSLVIYVVKNVGLPDTAMQLLVEQLQVARELRAQLQVALELQKRLPFCEIRWRAGYYKND